MGNLAEDVSEKHNPVRNALIRESRIIAKYLSGREPASDLINRYVEANEILFAGEPSRPDLAILDFIRRNPRSLPYLDAVLGLVRPSSLLRSKILLMVALLEATPEFTSAFLPESFSITQFLWRMTGYGISTTAKIFIGLFIYPFAANVR